MVVQTSFRKLSNKLWKKKKDETENEIRFEKIVSDNIEKLKIKDKEEENILKCKWINVLKQSSKEYGKSSIGNKVEIFNNGYDVYTDILKEIKKSKKRIWFEVYIFDDSPLAETVVDSLCDAGNRGCDVILLIDFIGSFKFKNTWIKKLRENKVQIIFFNSFLNSFFNSFPFFFRDHRKIIITDDVAYCGSMNVAENVFPSEETEMLRESTEMVKTIDKVKTKEDIQKRDINLKNDNDKNIDNKNIKNFELTEGIEETKQKCLMYYDLHLKIKGPAVKHLADVFIDSLEIAQNEIKREPIEEQKSYVNDKDSCYIQILESNVLKKKKSIQLTFESILRNATNNIYITTSYFLPPGFLRRALLYALSKGVNISFLFSGNSDILGDVPATYYIIKKFLKKSNKSKSVFEYSNFLKNNVQFNLYKYLNYKKYIKTKNKTYDDKYIRKRKIRGMNHFYFLQNKHCHAKNIVVDNLWSAIGSFNWDRYSSRRNLEVMISIFDKNISDKFIQEHKEKIKNNSIHVTLPHILNRNIFQIFMSYCFYHLGKLSGKNIFDGLSNTSKKTLLRKALVKKYLKDNCIQNISLNMMWAV